MQMELIVSTKTYRFSALDFIRIKIFNIFFVPTFEENGIFMLGVVFFNSVNFRRNSFQQHFLYPIKDIEFLSSNLKRYFTFDCFL